jgi:hypothetical protein
MKCSVSVREKFKVKIKSLAEESRIIRHQVKRLGQDWKHAKGPADGAWPWDCERYKIASAQGSLHWHRIDAVRRESRHALLAYAFVRGVPYSAVERSCDVEADASTIERIVRSLSRAGDTGPAIQQWLARRDSVAA